ncbi:RNA polymerase sigma factor [Pseudomonas sp. LRF_L74]|uniref:RNA polymerase sigma factor n=1 Tax=Pseudomonas sp. LRF_L74 TaxID=3369422 RepID=UPI003F621874
MPENDPSSTPPRTSNAEASTPDDVLRTFLDQQDQLRRQLSRWVRCRSTAADLMQELFIRFWRRRDIQVDDLGPYMMRSARNLAVDHLRSQGSRQRSEAALLPEQWLGEPSTPEAGAQGSSELRLVEAALRDLPERTRQIFLLNRVHGQTYGEIADAMDISASAVEKHMMRALDACKQSLAVVQRDDSGKMR